MQQRQLAALLAAIAVLVLIVLLGTGQFGRGPQPGPSETASSAAPTSVETGSPPAATPTTASIPAVTGLSGRIIFTRAGGSYGDETLFIANIDGSDERQLGQPTEACCPWLSRDGARLAWTTSAEDGIQTLIADGDGSNALAVDAPSDVRLGSGPFSPDGSRIVLEGFTRGMSLGPTYIANVDGSNRQALVDEHFIPGDFSPDGKQVLLFKPSDPSNPRPGSLWTVNLDGSKLRQLTPPERQVQCCTNYRWSADGSKIIFATPGGGLWTIAPDGTGLTEIFQQADAWAITPTWSPDGSMILFGLDSAADPFKHPANGFYVIRSDGTGLTLVLGGNDFKREPIWAAP